MCFYDGFVIKNKYLYLYTYPGRGTCNTGNRFSKTDPGSLNFVALWQALHWIRGQTDFLAAILTTLQLGSNMLRLLFYAGAQVWIAGNKPNEFR